MNTDKKGKILGVMKENMENSFEKAELYENLAKKHRTNAEYWKKQYNLERTYTSVLAPLFVDDVRVIHETIVHKTKVIFNHDKRRKENRIG